MTETLLLIILAAVVTIVIFLIRKWVAAHQQPLGKRVELGIRILLTFLAAILIHWFYSRTGVDSLSFWLAVASNCLILYAVTHITDRLVLKG